LRRSKLRNLLEVLKRIEAKGVIDTAHRTRDVCGRIFRYAIATGRAKHDIAADLVGALAPRTTQHLAAITDPAKVGALLRAIDGYDGQPTTGAALRLAPYVFVQPGELRAAAWSEIVLDGDEPLWRIPAERMKLREAHIVPLARQSVDILRTLQPITGRVLKATTSAAPSSMSKSSYISIRELRQIVPTCPVHGAWLV
jgi:integrase